MTRGRSLELFFVNGAPDGILTAEVFNWTGHVISAPRVQLKEALARQHARQTGVYLLLGENDGEALAYVGEGENVADRIKNHDANKDWWDRVVIVTTAADSLHKAHARYLEARLIEKARQIRSLPLENGYTPARASLSEAAQANMEEFLDTLGIVLPAIGVSIFENRIRPDTVVSSAERDLGNQRFQLATPKHNIEAFAELRNSEFVVLEGSRARHIWAGAGEHDFGYRQLHTDLVRSGIIDVSSQPGVFTQNYAFNSPSAAAAVVNGRPANGRTEWKTADTKITLKAWEAAQLSNLSVEPE